MKVTSCNLVQVGSIPTGDSNFTFMIKVCNTCHQEKNITDFRKDKSQRDGYTDRCKPCRRLYDKANYCKYRASATIRNTNRYHTSKNEIIKYKESRGCLVCKETDHVCLEFHHLDPNKKDFTIGEQVMRNWKTILPEIEKCVVLCSNCHRKFHAGRFALP